MSQRDSETMLREADELTRRHPPGTPCRYWPGAREGDGRQGRLRTAFAVTSSGEIVVWIDNYPGWIAATHVEVRP